jgi:hypothetical protein
MKKMLNEGNQILNFISSSGSGTVINYGSGSDFLTSSGSGSKKKEKQKNQELSKSRPRMLDENKSSPVKAAC